MALLSLSVNFHASAQPACVPAPSGLAAWWRAENNADEVVGGLTGTLFNGTTFVGGTVGQAFGFNGTNQYLEVADAPALTLTNELTIEFWVKRERPDGPNVDFVIEKGGDWTGGMQNYGVSCITPGTIIACSSCLPAAGAAAAAFPILIGTIARPLPARGMPIPRYTSMACSSSSPLAREQPR